MASFVLVHGSTQNASGWDRVRTLLAERGHRVSTPQLPKQAPDWGFEDYAAEIARAIQSPQTLVVAHSMSGAFLPSVPRFCDCARLVFLAAAIPEPGKSARDQLTEDSSMFPRDWLETGPRWFQRSEHELLAREFLFHDCDDHAMAWALGTVDLLDARHLFTRPQPDAGWPAVASDCIIATLDRTISPDWSRTMSKRVLRTDPIEIQAGHCPHVSQPAAVASILDRLARADQP
jgi:pimeloyl-ACP methyl ester carboxylesterase